MRKKFNIKYLQKRAQKDLILTEDGSRKTETIRANEIYVVLPEFYEEHIKGRECEVTDLLKCKSIAILYSAEYKEHINFIHITKFTASPEDIKSILIDGIHNSKSNPPTLGNGIYVWSDSNKKVSGFGNKAFKINNYEGQFLKLVYYEGSTYYNDIDTEYLLLKTCQKNVISI